MIWLSSSIRKKPQNRRCKKQRMARCLNESSDHFGNMISLDTFVILFMRVFCYYYALLVFYPKTPRISLPTLQIKLLLQHPSCRRSPSSTFTIFYTSERKITSALFHCSNTVGFWPIVSFSFKC